MISVLLVDDHALVREGLKYYLETESEIKVVGEAGDVKTAAELAARLKPAVILMDLIMPGMNGVEGTKLCLGASPASKVIILTSKPEDDLVLPAIKAGALSYLLKDVSAGELVAAIREAATGKSRFHQVAAARIMEEVSGIKKNENLLEQVSPREMEVLQLIAGGFDNKEIGSRLFISERTVKTHVSHLLEKLGLRDRTQLAIYALQKKIFEEE